MAIYANLTADQGSTFISVVSLVDDTNEPLDLTGYTTSGQVRKTYSSTTSVDFTTTVSTPTSGEIQLQLTDIQTGGMKAGRYVYDVEISSGGGTVTRVIEGQLEITPSVTRG